MEFHENSFSNVKPNDMTNLEHVPYVIQKNILKEGGRLVSVCPRPTPSKRTVCTANLNSCYVELMRGVLFPNPITVLVSKFYVFDDRDNHNFFRSKESNTSICYVHIILAQEIFSSFLGVPHP
jgi:hypothetical protein